MIRREKLNDLAVTMEERQTYISQATTAEATYQTALANLEQARINFKRTQVRSPVNGYVTNLSAQLGNYADVGSLQLSVVNSDSYWVDAYFEETALSRIHEGDAATVKLMGYTPLLRGRVQGLARGVDVPNSAPDASGLASVNPIFTFVRLAQRVPVRIHIDEVPDDIKLVAGMTATVQIEPFKAHADLRCKTRAWESRAGRRAAGFVADSRRCDITRRASGSSQISDDTDDCARATLHPASDAAGARRIGAFASNPATARLAIGGLLTTASLKRIVGLRPALAAGRRRGGCGGRRSQDAPAADRRLPARRSRVGQKRRRNALERISGADLRPFRRSKRDARAKTPISRHDPQARPLQVASFAAESPVALAARGSAEVTISLVLWTPRLRNCGKVGAPLCLSPSVYRQKNLPKYTLIHTGELKSASNPRLH